MRYLLMLLAVVTLSVKAQVVTLPIQGAPGLYVTVGVGANSAALADLRTNPAAVNITMGDDDNRNVPLGFSFPYFNQIFTDSWMHSNGVVSFQNPTLTGNFCCSGLNLTTQTGSGFNYTIMPLWTDLIGSGTNNHYYLRGTNQITYGWYNVNEFGTTNSNSFEVKLDSAGLVDVRLQGALVSAGRLVTSGMTGNLAQGEYFQYYHGSGWNTNTPTGWFALSGTSGDICLSNPLSSPACPGYASAYFTQQCTVSALYDPTCPGYTQANFVYQCSINPLYNQLCPGYEQAYFNQQCSINGLYNKECPNYATAYATQQALAESKNNKQTSITVVTNNEITVAPVSVSPTNVSAPVQLVQPASPATATSTAAAEVKTEKKKEESKPQTRAQQIQQARAEAAQRAAASKGGAAMKEAIEAKSLEQQIALQQTIITAIGFNPAFDSYNNLILRDAQFYKPFEVYKNQNTVDNRSALRQLSGASDKTHNEMIQQQYK